MLSFLSASQFWWRNAVDAEFRGRQSLICERGNGAGTSSPLLLLHELDPTVQKQQELQSGPAVERTLTYFSQLSQREARWVDFLKSRS